MTEKAFLLANLLCQHLPTAHDTYITLVFS